MRQDDLISLFNAIQTGNTQKTVSEIQRLSTYRRKIVLSRDFCTALLDPLASDGADLSQGLMLAALLQRQDTNKFHPMNHFLKAARTAQKDARPIDNFFRMHLRFSIMRRKKDFVFHEELNRNTYPHELANVQLIQRRIGTWQRPGNAPEEGVKTIVFCASFLPESQYIKHAQLIIDNMVFLSAYRKDLRCVLVLTRETVFDDEVFSHFARESDNIEVLQEKLDVANARHGIDLGLVAVDETLDSFARFQAATRIIRDIDPYAIFYAGGYCKCESFFVSSYLRDAVPSVFLATSASNTVAPQYTAVFSKDDKNPLPGAEGKIKLVPSASFEGFQLDTDPGDDDFIQKHAGKKIIFSALSNERIHNALSACDDDFFVQLKAFLEGNPDALWVIAGVKNVGQVENLNPTFAALVKQGRIVVKGLIRNFGHYLTAARVFVSLPNSVGGGFSGFSATYSEIPTVYCLRSDLPGLFHLPDLGFDDTDYTGFFAAIDGLLNDPERYEAARQRLREIKGAFSLESVGGKRFEALEQVVADFHAPPAGEIAQDGDEPRQGADGDEPAPQRNVSQPS
ncbi:glycosyltransferase [Oceaniglobus trochenteri]|uniref:glycosyltransferase n=1 Tax=Oceaniglobus trochenteri TaxID=2763260 RepID=UPI001CFFF407|nr:hypothetical protein [Oceaniglobus trochenteri]